MAMFRSYMADSGQVAISSTGDTPLLYIAPTSTNDLHLVALKVAVETGGSAPTAVSNGEWFFSLNTVTGTKAGGASVTPAVLGSSSLAANTVFSSGSTALTGLTKSTEKWGGAVPFTAGAFAVEAWENTGREIDLAASSISSFYVNVPSGPGAGANWYARVIAWFTE